MRQEFRWQRWTGLTLLLVGAMTALGVGGVSSQSHDRRLRYVTTVRQIGPVAYRDPLGAMSPDGTWLATTSGLHLRVQRVAGGPVRELGSGRNRIASLAWLPGSRRLAVREQDMDRTTADWYVYDVSRGSRSRLWSGIDLFVGTTAAGDRALLERASLMQLAWSSQGDRVAGTGVRGTGRELWIFNANGGEARVEPAIAWRSEPRWLPDGRIACLVGSRRDSHLSLDCASGGNLLDDSLGVFGPLAVAPDGALIVAMPNATGFLDLWRHRGGKRERLTAFSRDAYAPYVAADGSVLFKVQDYRVFIATVAAAGGVPRAVTTFQAETPSWNWSGDQVAFTWGDWRRSIDDAKYPDIAQHVGTVRMDGNLPARAPDAIVRHSDSEDQGMHWSPNGRWIVLHSHAEGTDDLWLQPADGSQPAHPITHGGAETGWPRWSSDGRWIVYASDDHHGSSQRLGVLYVLGVDQETGEVSAPQREVRLEHFDGQVSFAEWSPDSRRIVFEALHGPDRRAIWIVDRQGGVPELLHEYKSEQWFSGIAVSPRFEWVAFVAPAKNGYFQLWRVPTTGGEVQQLTFDPTDKTQPSWSPVGDRIAFTIFHYAAHFWLLEP